MKVYDAIAQSVALEECATAFGLIGDGNMYLWNALNASGSIDLYQTHHEACAVAMADGYYQATKKIGVATITCGPGLTQIGTSLMSAVLNRSSMVIVVGDISLADKNHIQKIDQRKFVEGCGATFHSITSVGNVAIEVRDAFYKAKSEHTPVVLSIPLDIQLSEIDWQYRYQSSEHFLKRIPRPAPDDEIQILVEHIERAARPVIIAGIGAKESDARNEIIELGDHIGAVFATSLKAKGFFDGHPFDLGIAGSFSSAPTEAILANADFVLGIGAQLGYYTTEGGFLFPEASIARIDSNQGPSELGSLPGLYITGDAKLTLQQVTAALKAKTAARIGFRTEETIDALEGQSCPDCRTTEGFMDPRLLARELSKAIPDNSLVTIGAGHYWGFFNMYTSVPPSASLFYSAQLGAIGQTLALAIGVGIAYPQRPQLVLDGDGSVMMNIQELETMARYRMPIVVLVWNDAGFGAEAHKLRAQGFLEKQARWETSPRFVEVAKAFGGDGIVVEQEAHVLPAIEAGFRTRNLFVIDARVSPSVVSDHYLKLYFGQENKAPLLQSSRRSSQ